MTNKLMIRIYKHHKAILWCAGFFVVASIVISLILMTRTDVWALPPEALMTLSLDMLASIYATILFITTSSIVETDNRQGFVLSFLLGVNSIIFSLNSFYILIAGHKEYSEILMTIYSLYFFLGRVLNLLGLGYIYLVARPKGKFELRLLHIGVGIGIIDLLEVVFNHFFKFYFYINDSGYYARSGMLYYLCYLGPVAVLVIDSILIDRSPKEKRIKLSLTCYITVCVIFAAMQIVLPNVEVLFQGTMLSIIVLYCTTQNFDYKRRAREAAEREKMIAEQKMLLLQSQMHPHFLYNSMLSIRRLIQTNQEAAMDAMDNFIIYLRGNVDMLGAKEAIPIKQELDFIASYLKIQQTRFGEKVEYEIIENELDFKIPALTVQPLVENAISHGIRKRPSGAGKVTIETGIAEDEYWVEVKDNGVGFDASKPMPVADDGRSHVGFANAKLRVEALGGRVVVHSKIDKGTTVRLYLPMVK